MVLPCPPRQTSRAHWPIGSAVMPLRRRPSSRSSTTTCARWRAASWRGSVPGQTLAPTALVHGTYLLFAERLAPHAIDRKHFLAIAARAMRHVVIDHIRRRQALNRDAGKAAVALDSSIIGPQRAAPVDLLALDGALRLGA